MKYLSRSKLETCLRKKSLNISQLAKICGISRQSIYNMFDKSSVFSSSFEKILAQLDIDYKTITEDRDSIRIILSSFPDKIKKIVIELVKFTNDNSADLILFGSRAAGKTGVRHDWDFAVNFHKTVQDKKLRLLKQKLQDQSFPYRVDLVNLNIAPTWFKDSIDEDKIYLRKEDKDEKK